mgnify:CR=1 FL=1
MKTAKIFKFVTNRRVQRKVQNEPGRSMVEMLGVLAIIGVLSIGGIAGYTMAMNRYKANQILDLASKLSVMAQTGYTSNPDNWEGISEDSFSELGMENYDWGDDSRSYGGAYETTFGVEPEGNVHMWTGNNGVYKALISITGSEDRGGQFIHYR